MSIARQTAPGTTRTCPHCRTVILDSANTCPACKKHLRFDNAGISPRALQTFSLLRVEGSVRHPDVGEAWEYSVLISIKNDRGEEIKRQIVGVGALPPGEGRTFSFAVDMVAPLDARIPGK